MEKDSKDGRRPVQGTESGAFYFTRWLGALVYYAFAKHPFKKVDSSQYHRRNFIAGYVLTIISGLLLLVALFLYF